MSNGFVIERCVHDQPKGSCVFCFAAERDKLREQNYNLQQSIEKVKQNYKRFTETQIANKKKLLSQLTKAKGAIEEVAIITGDHLELDDAMVEIDAIVNKALTELEDKP